MSNLPNPQALLTVYDLSPGFYVERVEANVYYVASHQGDFALKIYPVGTSLDGQRYQHWLLNALEAHIRGFTVPTPVRNREGGSFYTAPNGATWVLAPRLSGQAMQPNDPDQAYEAGRALAEIHQAFQQIQPLPNPDFPDYDINRRILPSLRRALPDDPSKLGLQNTRESRYRLQRFIALVQSLEEPPLPSNDIHWHIIHGDFSVSNLLYDGERVVGVLDFEAAHPDYRIREFAETLMRITNDLGPLFWGTARTFVEGYKEKLRLTRPEIDLLPRFIVERRVVQVLEYCHSGQQVHAAQALRTQEEVSTWLESEQSRLLAMLRGIFLGE